MIGLVRERGDKTLSDGLGADYRRAPLTCGGDAHGGACRRHVVRPDDRSHPEDRRSRRRRARPRGAATPRRRASARGSSCATPRARSVARARPARRGGRSARDCGRASCRSRSQGRWRCTRRRALRGAPRSTRVQEPRPDVAHDVLVSRILLHGARGAAHVHQHDPGARARHHGAPCRGRPAR